MWCDVTCDERRPVCFAMLAHALRWLAIIDFGRHSGTCRPFPIERVDLAERFAGELAGFDLDRATEGGAAGADASGCGGGVGRGNACGWLS